MCFLKSARSTSQSGCGKLPTTAVGNVFAGIPIANTPLRSTPPARSDLDQRIAGEHVQRAVRSLPHLADPRVELLEQLLLGDDPFAVEHEPDEMAPGHSADEQVAAPLREQIAGVERHPGRRD